MNINVLTIFPEIFKVLNSGVISKAMKKDLLSINPMDIRKMQLTSIRMLIQNHMGVVKEWLSWQNH